MTDARDPQTGPIVLGSFSTLPNTVTTSPSFLVPINAHAVRITWRQLPGGFGLNPGNITVKNATGDILWSNIDIGLNTSKSNIRNSDIIVPVLPRVDNAVVVVVSELPSGDTHTVYVSAVMNSSLMASMVVGSEIVQPVGLATVGTNNVLTTFGEVAVGGYGGTTINSSAPAANVLALVTLPATPGFSWHVLSITASYDKPTALATKVVATDGFSTWQTHMGGIFSSGGNPLALLNQRTHFDFPDGGLNFLAGAGVTISLPAGGIGISGILSTCASNRLYGF